VQVLWLSAPRQSHLLQGVFQTWRSTLLNSVTFGTVAAAVPVLTLCGAFLHDRVLFPDSDMAVSVLRCTTEHIELAVANTGARPGVIGQGTVKQLVGSVVKSERDLIAVNRDKGQVNEAQSASLIIAPAQSTVLQMRVIRKNWPEVVSEKLDETSDKNCEYQVAIDIVDFGKTTPSSKQLKPCRCPGT
jgi:hypothetical protein